MNTTTESGADDHEPDWVTIVRHKVESLRYGVVQLVIHDGRVTQIERTEKTRLPGPASASEFAVR